MSTQSRVLRDLAAAAASGDESACACALALAHTHGINLDDRAPGPDSAHSRTALMIAAEHGHVSVVRRLLEAGAMPNERDDNQETALHLAARHGHTRVCRVLTDGHTPSADPRHGDGPGGSHAGSGAGGADIDAANAQRNTPLMLAAHHGCVDTCEALIDAGANLNVRNQWRDSPLILACVRAQACTGNPSHGGQPADGAAFTRLCELMIVRGADVNARGFDGCTPLIAASEAGAVRVVKALVQAGACVHTQDEGGATCLHAAAATGNAEISEILLGAGADANVVAGDGRTAFLVAAEERRGDVCALMIARRCVDLALRAPAGRHAEAAAGMRVVLEPYWQATAWQRRSSALGARHARRAIV